MDEKQASLTQYPMAKYRHLINIALYGAQLAPTAYHIYYLIANKGTPGVEYIVNLMFMTALAITLFVNKNVFTLLLGITLTVGNFAGLTAFETLTMQKFFLHIGSFSLPLYWGSPFYSLLLGIYILVNKGFYIGILTKAYWVNFLIRTKDLEATFVTVHPDPAATSTSEQSSTEPSDPIN